MTADTYTLMGLGIAAVVVVWLVFSVLKKIFGIALLVGLAFGAYYLWTNPAALDALTRAVLVLLGQ